MDHQFSEEEAREVFARAAERQHAVGAQEGLSLDELRAIGREAGLDPEHVEAAARAVATGEPETGRSGIGPVPSGVFRTTILPGPPSDALWEQVVADARRTFSAQGTVSTVGRLREWRNGNLRVSLEPVGEGASRLHLQTRRRQQAELAVGASVLAVVALIAVVVTSIDAFAGGGDPDGILIMAVAGALSAALVGFEQRRWAQRRERQFDQVTRRAADAIPSASAPEPIAARIDPAHLDTEAEEAPARAARRRTR